ERMSWYCRDTHRAGGIGGDSKGKIIFSNRNALSLDQLGDYLVKLFNGPAFIDNSEVKIHWNSLSAEFETYSHGKRAGLQLADAVASSFFRAVEPLYGFTEPRYAQMLRPVAYNHYGNYLSYGVKIFPHRVEAGPALDALRTEFADESERA